MTTATGKLDATQQIVAERWHAASTRLQEFAGDDRPGWVNSEELEAIHDNLRLLAYRMAGEDPNADQEADVERTFVRLMGAIEDELRDMAYRIECERAERRAAAA